MPVSEKDKKEFADAIRGARPLPQSDRIAPYRRKPKPRARLSRRDELNVLDDSIGLSWQEATTGEVEFSQRWVPTGTLRKLRRGQFSIEAEIDLHGLNRSEAHLALKEFVAECIDRRVGCIRVIHGKGSRSGPDGPVLKRSVQDWLARWDDVVAYSSAHLRHGGTGAIYVLLKRR